MSNTVMLYALTGETAEGKSLSTAEFVAQRLAERVQWTHGFAVPIIWHDVDYPLAKTFTGTSGRIEWPLKIEAFVATVVSLGGRCWQELRRGFPEPWQQGQPVHWRLPGTFEPAFIAAWAQELSTAGGVDSGS